MKLLRWAVAGASVYAVYRYSIGRKAKGEDVFISQEREIAKMTGADDGQDMKGSNSPKGKRRAARAR